MNEEINDEQIIQKLSAWNCDIAGALPRFINNKAFYCKLLREVPEQENFFLLEKALNSGDLHTAFEQAHTLKGMLGNMGLTPMYDEACAVVEPLRSGKTDGVAAHFQILLEQKAKLEEILQDSD